MKNINYIVEADDFRKLLMLKKALFSDGTHLTPDRRRDLANILDVILNRAIPIIEKETIS